MKNFNLIVGLAFLFFIGVILAWVSQYPVHYEKITFYLPVIIGSLAFIAFMITILFLTKKAAYPNQKMPKGEIWLIVVLTVGSIAAFIFLSLHLPSPSLHP